MSSVANGRPSASVIVVTYNAAPFIADCLVSVLNQAYPDFEAVIVDSGSTDSTAKVVRDHFPSVRVIESPSNIGYGAGNNLGARASRGSVLLFLNPDTVVEPNWLSALIAGMQTSGCKLATSKITLLKDHHRLNTSGNQIHYLGLSYCRGLNQDRAKYATSELVSGASGASVAITRDLFEMLGGFDETLFLYHDDVDLSLRALLAGARCLYVPESVARHDYELRLPPQKWSWVEAHRYAVLLKTYHLRTLLMLLPGLMFVDAITLAFLATKGGAYLSAKFDSYAWVIRNWRSILVARRNTQRVRAIDDRRLLDLLVDNVPFEQVAPGWFGKIADVLLRPIFAGYRRLVVLMVHW